MTNTAANIPVVIQQAGQAAKVQDAAQRLGEEQQIAAREADAEATRRRGSQVQRPEKSDAQNRVNVDQEGGEQRRRQQRGGSGGRDKGQHDTELLEGPAVVDVVI